MDTGQYRLSRDGLPVAVEPQVFDLLVYLIEHRERVVTRDELLDELWKGKVVSDSALNARLKAVRKAVGDRGDLQRIIKTVHGRGYQFVADVKDAADTLAAESTGCEDTVAIDDKTGQTVVLRTCSMQWLF